MIKWVKFFQRGFSMPTLKSELDMNKKLDEVINKNSKLHFIAIGGIGVSAVAKIFLQAGYHVSGSDIKENKNITMLKELGAEIFIGHKPQNVQSTDIIIASSAIHPDNPEIIEAKKLNLPIFHRSQALAYLMSKKTSIGASGTHGKTTTSGMAAFVLNSLNEGTSFAIGGIIPELKTNAQYGHGEFFVSELDESDGTILMYSPDVTIVTNLELDHVDFYTRGFEQLLETFEKFASNLKQNSKLVINTDNEGTLKLLERTDKEKAILYTTKENKLNGYEKIYSAKNIKLNGFSSSSEIYLNNNFIGMLNLNVPGEHNISDALGVVAALMEKNIKFEDISSTIKHFSGMGRRFEIIGDYNGAKIIDDYAHHPTEIKATLRSAKSVLKNQERGRLVVIFQPHRYSRFEGLWNEFLTAFDGVDKLYICDVYAAGEEPSSKHTPEEFAKQIKGVPAVHLSGKINDLTETVKNIIQPQDIVITMGAGDITNLGRNICKK